MRCAAIANAARTAGCARAASISVGDAGQDALMHGNNKAPDDPGLLHVDEVWCPGRDLNPDELPHTPLKRTRIPIPPPGLEVSPLAQVRGTGTEGGSRTHTTLRSLVPETSASTIPPPRHGPVRDRYRPAARRHVSTSQNRSAGSATCRTVGPSSVSRTTIDSSAKASGSTYRPLARATCSAE